MRMGTMFAFISIFELSLIGCHFLSCLFSDCSITRRNLQTEKRIGRIAGIAQSPDTTARGTTWSQETTHIEARITFGQTIWLWWREKGKSVRNKQKFTCFMWIVNKLHPKSTFVLSLKIGSNSELHLFHWQTGPKQSHCVDTDVI